MSAESPDSLDQAYEDVERFHAAFNHPVSNHPRALKGGEKSRRITWMQEEIRELEAAETIEDQADAIVDLIYFALGYLVEMGVSPNGIWRAVQQANMAKRWPDGVRTDAMGKVIKPDGWKSPEEEIRAIIASRIPERR